MGGTADFAGHGCSGSRRAGSTSRDARTAGGFPRLQKQNGRMGAPANPLRRGHRWQMAPGAVDSAASSALSQSPVNAQSQTGRDEPGQSRAQPEPGSQEARSEPACVDVLCAQPALHPHPTLSSVPSPIAIPAISAETLLDPLRRLAPPESCRPLEPRRPADCACAATVQPASARPLPAAHCPRGSRVPSCTSERARSPRPLRQPPTANLSITIRNPRQAGFHLRPNLHRRRLLRHLHRSPSAPPSELLARPPRSAPRCHKGVPARRRRATRPAAAPCATATAASPCQRPLPPRPPSCAPTRPLVARIPSILPPLIVPAVRSPPPHGPAANRCPIRTPARPPSNNPISPTLAAVTLNSPTWQTRRPLAAASRGTGRRRPPRAPNQTDEATHDMLPTRLQHQPCPSTV